LVIVLRLVACVLIILKATTDYQDGDLVKLEEKDKDRRRVGLKGRVAVEGMLRCLSEHREDAPPISEPKDESAKTEG